MTISDIRQSQIVKKRHTKWAYGVKLMEVLGKRLSWLRGKQRYSQKDIASMIGMTPSGYQKIELGQRDPKLDILNKLCDIFDVSSDFLLGRTSNTKELFQKNLVIDYYTLQIDELEEKHSEYMRELNARWDYEKEIQQMIFEEEANKKEKVRLRVFIAKLEETRVRITDLEIKINSLKNKIYELSKSRNTLLIEYISSLIDIPYSKPHQELKEYIPFSVDIQPDLFGEFSLQLNGKGVGFIGHYGKYKTEEDAVEGGKSLLKILNG